MDLPRAEIRYRGGRAVVVAIIRGWHRITAWLRPRAAPLLITLLATMCMFAGLDLVARDIHRRHAPPPPDETGFYLMSPDQLTLIPVELAPEPDLPSVMDLQVCPAGPHAPRYAPRPVGDNVTW